MEHQDWKTKIFNQKSTVPIPAVEVPKHVAITRNKQKRPVISTHKIEERVEQDQMDLPKVTHSLQLQIQKSATR